MGKTREDATWIFTSSIYEESTTIFFLCKYNVTMNPTNQNEKDKICFGHFGLFNRNFLDFLSDMIPQSSLYTALFFVYILCLPCLVE